MSTPSLSHAKRPSRGRLAAVAGLLAAFGCTDVDAPTGLPIPVGAANAAAVVVAPVTSAAIEDALDRITPALTDDRAAKPLRMALESLIDVLSQQGGPPVMAALERVEQTLDAYSIAVGPNSGDAAEQDGIALAIARVHVQLDTLPGTTR